MTRRLWILFFMVALAPSAWAQTRRITGSFTTTGSDCSSTASCVSLALPGASGAAVIQVSGTFTGTVQFEGTGEGGSSPTFVSIAGTPVAGGSAATSATSTGAWQFSTAGLLEIRVRCSAFSAGPIAVTIASSTAPPGSAVSVSGGNAAASATGSAVPSSADYIAGNVIGDALRGITATNTSGSTIGLDVNIVGGAAAGGTSSNFGAAVPAAGTAAGFSDGTDLQAPRAYDTDSGAGTEYTAGTTLRFPSSGGSVTADANSGNKSAGTLRVVLATDQPALTNKLLVTPDLPSGAATAAKQPALGTAGTPSADVITVQGRSGMTKILTTPDLPSGASTAAKQPALGTAGTASSDVITVQGIASMTKLLVTPDLPSGASTAAKQPALGTAGSASSDVITVQGIASMTHLLVTPDANSAVNVGQVGGNSVSTVASGVQKVGIVDSAGASITASTDPCDGSLAVTVPISQTASTKVISAASSKVNYICKIVLVAGAAEIISIVEGTGTVCGTSTTALAGSTTVANGLSFAANGGMSATGGGTAIPGSGTNVDTCLFQSGSNRIAGWLTYVQQ